jgi:DNA-binding MarR family transcriptional regulator
MRHDTTHAQSKAQPIMKAATRAAAPSVATPELGEVLEFMRIMWQLDHALQRTSKRMETSLGVTGPQRLVIRIVGRFPSIPAGQLAKLLHLHPSTLTGILKRLERQSLLRRRADPADARRVLLALTEKGRSFDVETEGTVEASVARVVQRAAAHKLASAAELLGQIAHALEEHCDPEAVAAPPRRAARRSSPPSRSSRR